MKIQVTQEEINNGTPCNAGFCPVALAVIKAFRAVYLEAPIRLDVSVTGSEISVRCPRFHKTFPAPESVLGFVIAFDEYQDVKPFEFDLEVPIDELM